MKKKSGRRKKRDGNKGKFYHFLFFIAQNVKIRYGSFKVKVRRKRNMEGEKGLE